MRAVVLGVVALLAPLAGAPAVEAFARSASERRQPRRA
jgi:hypothetical protein